MITYSTTQTTKDEWVGEGMFKHMAVDEEYEIATAFYDEKEELEPHHKEMMERVINKTKEFIDCGGSMDEADEVYRKASGSHHDKARARDKYIHEFINGNKTNSNDGCKSAKT